VIAFGGRVLGEGEPKYLNSPETPLFEKGRELYGLAQARPAIRAAGRAIVVEGYMDVVALAQHGIEYAVATLGTATSATHIQKLLRQTDEVVFCFDGDAAGRKAAWHALEVSLPHLADNKAMRFLFLPPEHDPDSFVREKGKEAFEKILETAQPLSEFFVEQLMGRVELKTYEGHSQLVHEAKPLLKQISARTLQRKLIQMIAATAYLDAGQAVQLTQELTEARLAARAPGPHRGAQAPALGLVRKMLQWLISKPALAEELSLDLVDQSSLEARGLVAVAEFCRENPGLEANIVVDHFQGTEFQRLLESGQAALLDTKLEPEQIEVDFRQALVLLQDKRRHQRFEALRVKPDRSPEEESEMLRLLRERNQVPVGPSNNAIISGSRSTP
jgi:DNA primase